MSPAETPREIDHPWRTEFRLTLALAAPIAATQLAYVSIGVVETLMLGRVGADAVAAGGLGLTRYTIPFLFALGGVSSGAPRASQARGGGDIRMVRRSVRQGLWAATLMGAICILILAHAREIFLLLGQSETNAVRAAGYIEYARWGLIPGLWLIALRGFVAVMDRARAALYVMLGGIAFTLIGNYALMYGNFGFPAVGVQGAGIVFAFANLLMCISLLLFAVRARHLRRFYILGRFWRPDWELFREVFRLGIPIGAMMLLEHALFATAIFMTGILGTDYLAAHMIAIRCISMAFMVPLGIGQAATIRVGFAIGRRDSEGVRRAGWTSLAMGTTWMSASALLFALAPVFLISLFLEADDPANTVPRNHAVALFMVAAGFQIVDGIQAIAAGILRGMKDTRTPLILAAIGYWGIGFPTGYYLAFEAGMAGVGVWLGLAAGLTVVALALTWRFHRWRPAMR